MTASRARCRPGSEASQVILRGEAGPAARRGEGGRTHAPSFGLRRRRTRDRIAGARGSKPKATPAPWPDPKIFENLEWRNIGPANMMGRVADIEGVPGDPDVVYVGSASGGVWKSVDAGISWKPIFDKEVVASIGDIALEPGNPEVVYVGTGESNVRDSVSFGSRTRRRS